MSGKPEAGVHFSRFAFSPTVIMAWRGVGAALTMTMTIANGIGASPRSTVVCVVATPSCLCYMLIVVLKVKNVPTNHLLVPSSLKIETVCKRDASGWVWGLLFYCYGGVRQCGYGVHGGNTTNCVPWEPEA